MKKYKFHKKYRTQVLIRKENLKENFADNHGHNIFRIFDVLPNFPFTTSDKSLIFSNKLVYTSCLTSFRTT